MTDGAYAVEVDHFSFRYGEGEPIRLRDVDFRVRRGEWVAVIGPSGGGKSTLSMAVNGIIPHEFERCEIAGRVLVAGLDTRRNRPQDLVVQVGTVLQDPEWQLTRPTVEDEIAFGLENLGVPASEIGPRVDEALAAFQLLDVRDRAPEDLSGGQKQRVAIAAAFAMRPGILLLDEPLSELDPLGKESLLATVDALRRKSGATVLFIDHNVELVVPMADRVVVIAGGECLADTTPRELFADGEVLARIGFEAPLVAQAFRIAWPDLPSARLPLSAVEGARFLGYPAEGGDGGSGGGRGEGGDRDRGDGGDAEGVNGAGASDSGAAAVASAPDEGGAAAFAAARSSEPATGSREALLTLDRVSFAYPRADGAAVSDVSLSIAEGSFVSLIGANGAGKSTLARLVAGLLRPTTGEVRVDGQPLSRMPRADAVRRVGYVFQNPDFQFFNQSVRREIAFGLNIQKVAPDEAARRVEEVAAALELSAYLDEHPHFLSRGERRRVAIAAMLALRPRLLVLDEPTAGLDQAAARRMVELVLELKQAGHAILLVTHEMRLVAEASDRVLVMRDGRLWMDDVPDAIFARAGELRSAGIVLPPLMDLGRMLADLGAPITVDPSRMGAWLASTRSLEPSA